MTIGQEQAAAEPAIDPVAGKSVAEIFGEIAWLMSQDQEASELRIKDLERLVMPPILLKQFHIKYVPVPIGRTGSGEAVYSLDGSKPRLQPFEVELYAMCSEVIAARLRLASPVSLDMTLSDWRSGTIRQTVLKTTIAKTPPSYQ